MLALRTGWTPDTISGDAPDGIADEFRRAAHWALYAEAMTTGYADVVAAANADIPEHLDTAARQAFRDARSRARALLSSIQVVLGLADEDTDEASDG